MKKIIPTLLWLVFLSFAALVILSSVRYVWEGLPASFNRNSSVEVMWFALHIITGALVLVLAVFQFNKNFRNRNLKTHRLFGKLYVSLSIISVLILVFNIIPNGGCIACRPSQTMASILWLAFCVLAWYFIKKKKVVTHQRLMISSFICAAYFVSVRLVDSLAMRFISGLFPDESTAYFISDVTAWLLPLICVWMYWLVTDKRVVQT
jgi:uncharacterized membrane protein YozB (DUF420 family)